jgi:hypothetical protein
MAVLPHRIENRESPARHTARNQNVSMVLIGPNNLQAALTGLSGPLSRLPEDIAQASARRFRVLRARATPADREVGGRHVLLLSLLVGLLHLGSAVLYVNRDRSPQLVRTPEVEIELLRPTPEPPPEIEPPPPVSPPPKLVRPLLPPPMQPQTLRTAPAEHPRLPRRP